MSGSNSFQRGEEPPVGLSINLSSNNPFRNRAASPSSPFDDPPPRPVSRNPFIDQPPPPIQSPGAISNKSDHKSLSAEEIFNSLTLDDKKPNPPSKAAPPPPLQRPRGENVPPGQQSNRHRPTPSQEEALRARKMQGAGQRPGAAGSPPKKPQQRRPRRNSESSTLDFDSMPLTEEEKRMIARRRERERQRRERVASDGQEKGDKVEKTDKSDKADKSESREGRSRSKPGRPSRRMDIIDQLDATSIYGTGFFHHDGPFDALNPHRNRNTSRRAPMQAFPKDSLNNSIGGAGPLNRVADHSTFMGQNNDEAFKDYSTGSRSKPGEAPIFDPIARGSVIHGDESVGLGTSTFLEGTPAARAAIVRHRQEQAQAVEEGGLQRKKSLAQRIRHINKGPREYNGASRMTNPDSAYNGRLSPAEGEPRFSEFSKGEDSISVRPREGAMSPTTPPPYARRGSSGGVLERRATTDATAVSEEGAKSSGILGRMKSLKGGRKARNADGTTSPPDNSGSLI